MTNLVRLLKDFVGLLNICGPAVAAHWLLEIICNLKSIAKRGDLQPADQAMGSGPFKVTLVRYGCKFMISGPQAISGVREMYVRDVYLRDGWLRIKPGDTVLDLGANMGNFTNLALAIESTVRVIAVEPSINLNNAFTESVGLNVGHLSRTSLVRAFLGRPNEKIEAVVSGNENYADAEWITEEQLLERANIQSIDFIKCDIEGGEFGLLTPNSKLLAMTGALACEVHAFAGDVTKFIADVESCGFVIGPVQRDPDGSATFLAKRIA